MPASKSCIRCRSEWQAPAPPIRTTTSPGPGRGSGTSTSTPSDFHAGNRNAYMARSLEDSGRHALQADEGAGVLDLAHVPQAVLVDPALGRVQPGDPDRSGDPRAV